MNNVNQPIRTKICSNVPHDLNSFEVLKQCKSDFQAKIHEALLIKKHRLSLNKQYYMVMARFFCEMSTNGSKPIG